MEKKELEEVMRVVNKVIDKKIHKLKIELSGEMEKHDKRIGKVEKNSQTIYQELNFYIDARRLTPFMKMYIFCGKMSMILNGLMTWHISRKYVSVINTEAEHEYST